MNKPSSVKQAVIAILFTLAVNASLALYMKLTGRMSSPAFYFTVIFCALLCIIPYKINNKSNAARYTYLVISIASVFMLLGSDFDKYKLENTVSLFLAPIEIFIIYRLFQKETSEWFRTT